MLKRQVAKCVEEAGALQRSITLALASVRNQCESSQLTKKDHLLHTANNRIKELESLLINQSKGDVNLWVHRYLTLLEESSAAHNQAATL